MAGGKTGRRRAGGERGDPAPRVQRARAVGRLARGPRRRRKLSALERPSGAAGRAPRGSEQVGRRPSRPPTCGGQESRRRGGGRSGVGRDPRIGGAQERAPAASETAFRTLAQPGRRRVSAASPSEESRRGRSPRSSGGGPPGGPVKGSGVPTFCSARRRRCTRTAGVGIRAHPITSVGRTAGDSIAPRGWEGGDCGPGAALRALPCGVGDGGRPGRRPGAAAEPAGDRRIDRLVGRARCRRCRRAPAGSRSDGRGPARHERIEQAPAPTGGPMTPQPSGAARTLRQGRLSMSYGGPADQWRRASRAAVPREMASGRRRAPLGAVIAERAEQRRSAPPTTPERTRASPPPCGVSQRPACVQVCRSGRERIGRAPNAPGARSATGGARRAYRHPPRGSASLRADATNRWSMRRSSGSPGCAPGRRTPRRWQPGSGNQPGVSPPVSRAICFTGRSAPSAADVRSLESAGEHQRLDGDVGPGA
jgi:hypothetical protein